MQTRIGDATKSYSPRGITTYSIELWHDGLKKHRLIRGGDLDVVRRKAELQAADWGARWQYADVRQRGILAKNRDKQRQEDQKAFAVARTAEAQQNIEALSGILRHTLDVNDAIDWERLKDDSKFTELRPKPSKRPDPLSSPSHPREPQPSDPEYEPRLGFLDKLFTSRADKKVADKQTLYQNHHAMWSAAMAQSNAEHASASEIYESEIDRLKKEDAARLGDWEKRKAEFYAVQAASNAAIDSKRNSYLVANPDAVVEYCDLVLASSEYPDFFPKEFEIGFDPNAKVLIVDYALPTPDQMPRVKTVKYVVSRGDFEEQYISESQAAKLFDDLVYQIVLRTVHELFEADAVNAIQTIVFNGIVTAIDRSKGIEVSTIIVSLRANREEFLAINLALVEPKTCFKSLKGVGSSKLHGITPIAPIMPLQREDGRFVSAYAVAGSLDQSVNLAAMDWEDFEHLIREVFEKEFSVTGGEVRVTQASRDGGVDAVAFDPDPIRGGKIVIQAKRYTNTVGVGAVRDLYGTVLNEGATKGILVTTADFGPDSYSFANGKPLVLLSGSNLLHLLQKHGHSARINLGEAKRVVAKA